jgi:hypothetical protein
VHIEEEMSMDFRKPRIALKEVVNENKKTCGSVARGRSCRDRNAATLNPKKYWKRSIVVTTFDARLMVVIGL